MATNCKIIIGYKDHMDYWNSCEVYYRHYDGYTEAIKPLILEHKANITAMNEVAEYEGHKFEKLENLYDGVTRPDYLYYIDMSDRGNVKVSVLKLDYEFYRLYNIDNYVVDTAFSFDGSEL